MRSRQVRRRMIAAMAFMAATLAAVSIVAPARAQADELPVIAVAANLRFAAEEIAASFEHETGFAVRLSFGSTGNFALQIREGAPFEMLMAADEQTVLDLARDGFARDPGLVYADGRLVIAVPDGGPLEADGTLEDLRQALQDGRLTRFAIANPEHAPYGVRAMEALRHAGIWEEAQPFLVIGENVSQAAQFALSGDADGGIIAYSLALAPDLAEKGAFDLVPAEWHGPLTQRMALMPGAGAVAEAFYDHVRSPPAQKTLRRYGFLVPE